jgi:hypothetical protein
MKRAIMGTALMTCAGWLTFGQSPETQPKFEAADVHVSAKPLTRSLGPDRSAAAVMK